MFSKMMITTKMLVASIATLACVLTVGIAFIGMQSASITQKISEGEAKAVAGREAALVKAELEYGLHTANKLGETFSALRLNDNPTRTDWTGILKLVVEQDAKLAGTWGAVIQNELDGKDKAFVNAEHHDATASGVPISTATPMALSGSVPLETWTLNRKRKCLGSMVPMTAARPL
nr:hypothetical protein [uncultured Cohaesibacter sp.]